MKNIKAVLVFSIIILLGAISVSALPIARDMNLNLQMTDGSGVIETGAFNLDFRIANDAACTTILYSDLGNVVVTDQRGIVNFTLSNIPLDFKEQYWLCYSKNGTQTITKIARAPYSYYAENVSGQGIMNDSNLDLTNFNITGDWGLFNYLGSILNNIKKLFIEDIDFSGTITGNDIIIESSGGNVNTTGNVTANYFVGDGSLLTGITSGLWTDVNGNATYTIGMVGIGTTTPSHELNVIGDANITGNIYGTFIGDGSGLTGVGEGNQSSYFNKTGTSHTGTITNGSLIGYVAANEICNVEFPGTHLCHQYEIIRTIDVKNISELSQWVDTAWIATGGAKYSPAALPVNDCNGFTHGVAGSYLGAFWMFNQTDGGTGGVGHCANSLPLACCKKW